MATVEFGIQIVKITDETKIAGSDFHASLSKTVTALVPELLRNVQGAVSTHTQPNEYKVLIARQVTDLNQTLESLEMKQGDYIFLVQPVTTSVKLRLYPSHKKPEDGWLITESGALIGRYDEDKNIYPDVDLTKWLKKPTSVSRRQAELRENQGNWEIFVFKEAKGVIYLDQTLLEPDRPYPLKEGASLIFGSLLDPSLQLSVAFVNH